MQEELTIISFNVGLTRLTFIPFKYNFVPMVAERVQLVPAALKMHTADVICLQEVFENRLFKKLKHELSDMYPYAYHDNKGWKLFNKGLAIFSKHRFEHIHEIGFKTVGIEKFAHKGASVIRFIQGPHTGLVLANVHFPYGGYVGNSQAFAPIVALRNKMIDHLHGVLREVGQQVVMAGDFNFGPTVAEQNYEYVLSLGYTNLTNEEITWDPKNPMNRLFLFARPHSLDHIFTGTQFMKRITHFKNEVLFKNPVTLKNGAEINLSDHFGVLATLRY